MKQKGLLLFVCAVLLAVLSGFSCKTDSPVTFKVTFLANGGIFSDDTDIKVMDANSNGTINFPADPAWADTSKTFDSWYTAASGGTKVQADTKVTENKTFYAQYVSSQTSVFTVTFNANEGKFSDNTTEKSETTAANGTVKFPANPVWKDISKIFDGWYPNADGSGTKATEAAKVTNDKTLYAKYVSNETPVTEWHGLTVPSATSGLKYTMLYDKNDVLHVSPSNTSYDWAVLTWPLNAYTGQEITINVSMDVYLTTEAKIAWQLNTSSYPVVCGSTTTPYTAGTWHTITGSITVTPETTTVLYLSKDQLGATGEAYFANFTAGNGDVLLHTKWPFPVGVAAPTTAFTTSNKQYPLLKHFRVYVAENDMKPEAIMPTTAVTNWDNPAYRWTNADKLVDYAQTNGKKSRGHVLIWHSQTPTWFFSSSGTSGAATKAQLYERMENHIKTVMKKYGNKIDSWDVCNEVVDDSGSQPRTNSKYTQIMEADGLTGMARYDYVLQAFKWARQYADANGGQNVKLYLTDYNIEYSGGKQDQFYNLAKWLKDQGAPIDGVGFQMHIKYNWPDVSTIGAALDRLAGLGLKVQVTELDISLFKYDGEDTAKLQELTDEERDSRLALQATKYRNLFDLFKQKYNNGAGPLTMVLIWGLADAESWLNNHPVPGRTDYPLLFDRNYQPKAAFNKLVE